MLNKELKILMVEPLGEGGIAHYTFNLINSLLEKRTITYLFTSKKYEFNSSKVGFPLFNQMFKLFSFLSHYLLFLNDEKPMQSNSTDTYENDSF